MIRIRKIPAMTTALGCDARLWSATAAPMRRRGFLAAAAAAAGLPLIPGLGGFAAARAAEDANAVTTHALSLFGDVKYPADFDHFTYANPDAPKGGTLRLAAIGGFDSLNPFIVKGDPAAGLSVLGSGLVYESLMTLGLDEPSTEYGLIAESVTRPDDAAWVEFTLRAEARFADGAPVTPEDVVWTFDTLREQGQPLYRFYYKNVVKIFAKDARTVRFEFDAPGNRELPQIVSQLPILPRHGWGEDEFSRSSMKKPLGSGPYEVETAEANRRVVYRRRDDWWAKDLPVARGYYNFDRIAYEYYRDDSVALEAFKAGKYDVRSENSAKNWATSYDFPAQRRGLVKLETFEDDNPEPMQAFVYNLRRPKFADRRVRRAFDYAFDFDLANRTLFYDQYRRTTSFFEGSELAAPPLPDDAERALLEPFRDQLPAELFDQPYETPSGDMRANLRKAVSLLKDAGWTVRDGVLTQADTGETMDMEFLIVTPAMERVVLLFINNLKRLGVRATARLVDAAQYENRMDGYDFDVAVGSWPQSLSPGNEQREFFGSDAADRPGGRNLAGIKDPVVDALIERIVFAKDRAALVTACHALDRVLLWRWYVTPQFHSPYARIAYWDRFGRPETLPSLTPGVSAVWWEDAEKAKRIDGARRS